MFITNGRIVAEKEGLWLGRGLQGTPKVLTKALFLTPVEDYMGDLYIHKYMYTVNVLL